MRVVVDSELKEVGEQAIFVVGGGRIDEFRYLVRSEARTGRARPEDEKLSGVRPFRSGSAEHGDFAYTTLAPREAGVGAVGIYFVEGRLGLLYHPLKFDVPEKYVEIGLGDFKRAVVKEHGFHLEGIGIGASDAFD